MKVTVYSAPWCPWCNRTKEWLKEHNVKFTEKNVDKDQKAAEEMIEISGQNGIPVTDVDGEIVVGYDVAKLKQLLKIKE